MQCCTDTVFPTPAERRALSRNCNGCRRTYFPLVKPSGKAIPGPIARLDYSITIAHGIAEQVQTGTKASRWVVIIAKRCDVAGCTEASTNELCDSNAHNDEVRYDSELRRTVEARDNNDRNNERRDNEVRDGEVDMIVGDKVHHSQYLSLRARLGSP